MLIFLFTQYFVSPHYGWAVWIGTCSQVGEARIGRGTVPMLHIGRTHHDIAWMQYLYRLTFYLMVSDAVGCYQYLTSRMAVPGIDDTRLEHDVVKSWSTCYIWSIHCICQTNRPVECRQ